MIDNFGKGILLFSNFMNNISVVMLVKKYGIVLLGSIIQHVKDAELLFSQPGKGKEKFNYVSEKVLETLNAIEKVDSDRDVIPDYIIDVINLTVKLVNSFVK